MMNFIFFLTTVYQIDAPPPNANSGSPLWHMVGPFVVQLGFGGFLGWAVGYFSKKILKLLAILAAIAFLVIQFLVFKGYIEGIHWTRIAESFKSTFDAGFFDALWHYFTYNLPFGGAFAAGFFLGLKM